MSCGSGSTKTEDPQSRFLKSLISLGNDFLNVFTSFSDIVGGVLGFNTNTKKSDVGNYFKKVHDTLSSTKTSLEKIVSDMKSDNNPNAEATGIAVKALITNTLDKIIQGAKTASEAVGTTGDELLGNVGTNNAAGVAGTEVDKLVKGIKDIVDVVLKDKGNADAGTDKKAEDLSARTANGNGEAGKLFANDNAGDAAKAKAKDGTIAGAIALTAMAKNGKFAGPSAEAAEYAPAVKGAAISAVIKALDTLTIAIRETIDVGLKTVKDAMKFNSTDTPVTTDNTISEIKKN
ncbi:variable large family protein (plasmid) [Borrelia parkeri]|uniref:variable large family protein n=1 Tax=Borrelia parkeri TaxID=141 RepID=UPI001FF6EF36|nr:variable large family protein [Borrelia parkeri]UPA11519.1 variable large family protein [Borrelia parkeri]UPA11555.1 variable large family protein [Borrelia parkeri]UPA11698.1 variable large family protein [Borrelia parkeri]